MSSTREAYGAALTELADKYEFFVLMRICQKPLRPYILQKISRPFTDMGIAECNMMGYAAGYAASGAVVFASTFAAFAAGRAYDQIRNSIAYPNLNVKIAATHGGVLIGADGGSHQCVGRFGPYEGSSQYDNSLSCRYHRNKKMCGRGDPI